MVWSTEAKNIKIIKIKIRHQDFHDNLGTSLCKDGKQDVSLNEISPKKIFGLRLWFLNSVVSWLLMSDPKLQDLLFWSGVLVKIYRQRFDWHIRALLMVCFKCFLKIKNTDTNLVYLVLQSQQ